MSDPSGRRQATQPQAVYRLDVITSGQPEHGLQLEQQLSALRALLMHIAGGAR